MASRRDAPLPGNESVVEGELFGIEQRPEEIGGDLLARPVGERERDLDRVTCWLKILGMVNSAPGFNRQPSVINGFTDLIVKLYGPEKGSHARSAVGMAELPFDIPVEIEGEVEIRA